MRQMLFGLTAGLMLVCAAGCPVVPQHNVVPFSATLDAAQETEDVASTATGEGTFELDEAEAHLHYHVTASGLTGDPAAAHFHNAPRGTDGPVVENIFANLETDDEGNVTIEGTWEDLTADEIAAIKAGDIYVNIHTAMFPGGEIRGQVEADE